VASKGKGAPLESTPWFQDQDEEVKRAMLLARKEALKGKREREAREAIARMEAKLKAIQEGKDEDELSE
jgi:hypothetical protein